MQRLAVALARLARVDPLTYLLELNFILGAPRDRVVSNAVAKPERFLGHKL